MQLEVELHFAVFDLVLEMDVMQAVILVFADVGEGQVVRADEAYGAAGEKGTYYAFGSNEAVFRVCALEEFVEQEEERGDFFLRGRRCGGGG